MDHGFKNTLESIVSPKMLLEIIEMFSKPAYCKKILVSYLLERWLGNQLASLLLFPDQISLGVGFAWFVWFA